MKLVKRTLFALLTLGTLALAAVTAALWLVASERGSAWLVARALARANGVAVVARVEGSLLRGLTLHGVRVRLPQDEVDIERLAVVLDASAALQRIVTLESVTATRIDYRRLPGGSDAPRAPVSLPITLRVEAATFDALTATVGERTFEVGPAGFAATFEGSRLALTQVSTETSGISLRGDAAIDLGEALALEGEIEWRRPGEPELAGVLAAAGDWPTLAVRHELTAPFAARAEGSLSLAGTPAADLVVEWRDAAWPGVPAASPSGRATVSGTLEQVGFAVAADVVADVAGENRLVAVDARGDATRERVTLEAFSAALAPGGVAGTVQASGVLGLAARDFDLELALDAVDPGWLAPDWPGRVTGSARATGALAPALNVSLADARLDGELRGVRLEAGGAGSYANGELVLNALEIAAGANTVTLDGRASTAPDGGVDVAVAADVARLDELWPDAFGAVALTAEITGTRSAPRVRARARGRALEYAGVAIDALELTSDAGLAPDDALELAIRARGVRRGSVDLEELRVDATGTATAHRVDVTARREDLSAALAARGGIADRSWSGVLEDVRLDEALGDWRLVEPAPLAFAPPRTSLGTTCLIHESGASACVELTLEGRPEDRVLVSVQNIDLGSLEPVLPPQLAIEGIYQVSASFTDPTGEARGAFALTGGTTRITLDMGEQAPFTTELYDLIVSATLVDGRLELMGSVADDVDGSVELVAAVEDVTTRDSPISGRLAIYWPDLAVVSLLSPDIGDVAGVLNVDLVAGGTVDEPELEGRVTLRDGRVDVPAWGLTVTDIGAEAMSADGRALDFTATGVAGDGDVRVAGRTELDPAAGWPTRLTLQGADIRAVQRADAEVFVSPDLSARIALPEILVTGNVHVPRARIELSSLPAQAIAPSRDAVVHDRESARVVRPLKLRADIDFTLGDDVDYSGLNLTTDVTGRLKLRVGEDRVTTATGELSLIGTYNAYGQVLELERGQLIFSGPLSDPGLDVRAVRTVDDKRVGVELAGSLKSPRTRIFSNPVMSEADALSYLLLGRPLHGTGAGEETATLQTAALSMGLQQALPVVQRIGQTIGLDELSLQTTAEDAGELQAGKYLSPRLYIRYSYGLFNRIGGLLLRFKVNDRLSIETQSGDQQSMDLLYTVEKD